MFAIQTKEKNTRTKSGFISSDDFVECKTAVPLGTKEEAKLFPTKEEAETYLSSRQPQRLWDMKANEFISFRRETALWVTEAAYNGLVTRRYDTRTGGFEVVVV